MTWWVNLWWIRLLYVKALTAKVRQYVIYYINFVPTMLVPCWELAYPLPASTFESMIFLFPFGGICDGSLEGT